jgi:hypothetical protein
VRTQLLRVRENACEVPNLPDKRIDRKREFEQGLVPLLRKELRFISAIQQMEQFALR